ncbi:MAG: cupredoxin domain-containing protein [Herminiimonas sp.]|nr:cupredoxin domain-containing protein [Herminiimonas sp.]
MTVDHRRRKLCIGALAGMGALLSSTAREAQSEPGIKERVIKVTARKFQYTPSEINIRQGEAVVLEFTAIDFIHGFSAPDLHLRADLAPGQLTRVRIPTDIVGAYDFLCDNFCGSEHENMNGKIIVT